MKKILFFVLPLFIISLTNADTITIDGDSKIFKDFKTEALQYDTTIPAYHYAFLQELVPQTIQKMIKIDDDIGIELINQVSNLNDTEDEVGDLNIAELIIENKAIKCFKKLKEINYKFKDDIKSKLQNKISQNPDNAVLKEMLVVVER